MRYSSSYSVFMRFCSLSGNDRSHLITCAILRTSSLHIARFRPSAVFEPVFSVTSLASSRSFLVVLAFSCQSLHDGNCQRLSSSLSTTCSYYLTLFVFANRSTVSFYPCMLICPSVVFLGINFIILGLSGGMSKTFQQ